MRIFAPSLPLQVSQAGTQAPPPRTPGSSSGEVGWGRGRREPRRLGSSPRGSGCPQGWRGLPGPDLGVSPEVGRDWGRQAGLGWAVFTLHCGEYSGRALGEHQPAGFYPYFCARSVRGIGSPPAGKVHHPPPLRLPLGNLRGGFLVHADPSSSFPSGMAPLGHQKGQRQMILSF